MRSEGTLQIDGPLSLNRKESEEMLSHSEKLCKSLFLESLLKRTRDLFGENNLAEVLPGV